MRKSVQKGEGPCPGAFHHHLLDQVWTHSSGCLGRRVDRKERRERKARTMFVYTFLPRRPCLPFSSSPSLCWPLNDCEKTVLLLGAFSIGATGKIVDVTCQALSDRSILSVTAELSQL